MPLKKLAVGGNSEAGAKEDEQQQLKSEKTVLLVKGPDSQNDPAGTRDVELELRQNDQSGQKRKDAEMKRVTFADQKEEQKDFTFQPQPQKPASGPAALKRASKTGILLDTATAPTPKSETIDLSSGRSTKSGHLKYNAQSPHVPNVSLASRIFANISSSLCQQLLYHLRGIHVIMNPLSFDCSLSTLSRYTRRSRRHWENAGKQPAILAACDRLVARSAAVRNLQTDARTAPAAARRSKTCVQCIE